MKYEKVRDFCRRNFIRLPLNWYSHYNCVRMGSDKRDHFLMKARIVYELLQRKQSCFTEFKLYSNKGYDYYRNIPIADIFWLDEMTVVEIESEFTEAKALKKAGDFKPFNTIVINLKKHSVEDALKKIGLED